MYALKKLWLRLSLGRGPKLPPHLCVPIRDALAQLNPDTDNPRGLCGVIYRAFGPCGPINDGDWQTAVKWRNHQFKLWAHYSGDLQYPVPHPTLDPADAFYELPRYAGEYGAMRLNLAKHLIDAANRDLGIKP